MARMGLKLNIYKGVSHKTNMNKVKKSCEKLINCKIKLCYEITLSNNISYIKKLTDCNIIGNTMETIIYNHLKTDISELRKGPKQKSPDFYINDTEWELKCFNGKHAGFDISNFNSYVGQVQQNLERKLYKTNYLIIEYTQIEDFITIKSFKICKIYEILGYTGKYPITVQNKRGIWYNIRPCAYSLMNNKNKTPKIFIHNLCKAISQTPNVLENKENIINDIYKQFYKLLYDKVLEEYRQN